MTPEQPLGEPVIEVVPPVDLYAIGYSPANGWCMSCRHYRRYRDWECAICCAPFTAEDRPGSRLRSVNRGRHKRATRALAAALRQIYPASIFTDWLMSVPAPMHGNIAT